MLVPNIARKEISHTKRKKKVGNEAFVTSSESTEVNDTKELSAVRVTISSLWTLQAFDNRSAEIETMQKTGNAILNALDNVRIGMLSGDLNETQVINLSAALKNSEIELHFPDLQEALDDIKLRAAVELAKLEHIICN